MTDSIVVGGGLIGLATARELALAGQDVTVVDRGKVGRECSWAAGGILSSLCPWQESKAVTALSRYCREVYEQYTKALLEETGIDTGWQRSGLLVLDCGDNGDVVTWANSENLSIEIQEPDQIVAIEPLLGNEKTNAVWIPEIAQVRTPHLIQAMRASLQRLGVLILENTHVTGIDIRQGRFDSINTTGGSLTAEKVVIAAGAWSAELLGLLGYQVSLSPVRGQIICLKAPHPPIKSLLLRNGHYLIPRRDGHILIGSTVEETGFDNSTTAEAYDRLSQLAGKFSPKLETYPLVHHWAGLRPATADGLPLICTVADIEGLYLNTGHFRNGILQAPGSARLLVDIMLCRKSFMPVDAFATRDMVSV
jgi:glycine oxidase